MIIKQTASFSKWINSRKIQAFRPRIASRLQRLALGNFGDYKQLSSNLFELRMFFGNGLRIYYTIKNKQLTLLLVGGGKTTQSSDIIKAKAMIKLLNIEQPRG